MPKIVSAEEIARSILVVRGQRVLIDAELAALVAANTATV